MAVPSLFTFLQGEPNANSALASADQIWRWSTVNATWTKYYYMSANRGKVKRWVKDGDTEKAEDGYIRETTDAIPAGETFFFKRMGDTAVVLSLAGAVKPFDATAFFQVGKEGLAFAANPFPVAMDVKGFSTYYLDGEPNANSAMESADQIWRWSTANAAWTKYYYMSANRGKVKRWVKDGDTEKADDGYIRATPDQIPAGEGFFFKRMGDANVTIKIGMPTAE